MKEPNDAEGQTERTIGRLFAAASFILTTSLLAVLLAACPSATPTANDNAAPGAPAISSATPDTGKVTLEWTAPASTGFINGDGTKGVITKYTVYYSTSTITDRTAAGVESVDVTGSATLTKEVTNLNNSTEYFFRVTAWNAAGESEASNEKTTTTTAVGNAAPGAPTISSAAPDAGKVTLEWTAPASTGFINGDGTKGVITKYTVYYSTSTITDRTAAGVESVDVTGSAALTKEVTGLAGSTEYYFVVTAWNAAGESEASNEDSATTTVPTDAAPGAPTITATIVGDEQITLKWAVPTDKGYIGGDGTLGSITAYTVYYATATFVAGNLPTDKVEVSGATLTADVTNLTNDTEYFFRVTAANATGEGDPSDESSAAPAATTPTDAVPGAPDLYSTIGGNEQITVIWAAPSDTGYTGGNGTVGIITAYTVYYATAVFDSSSLPATKVEVSGETLTADVTGLTNNTPYFFRVAAKNATGEGPLSRQESNTPTVTGKPLNAPPGAPTITQAVSDQAGNITLVWSEPQFTGFINDDATPGVITDYTVYYIDSSTRSGDNSWGKNDAVGNVPIAAGSLKMRTIFLPNNVGQEVFFKMTATNVIGESELSGEFSGTVATPNNAAPGAPAISTTMVGNTQVTISWTVPANKGFTNDDGTYGPITAYTVYYDTNPIDASSLPTTKVEISGGTLTADVTGLTNGTKYYFRVTATNDTGEGTPSNESSASPAAATPQDAPPGAPTISAAAGDGQVTISWTALTDTGFTGGNGTVGTITAYTVYYADAAFDASNLPTDKVEVSGGTLTAVVPNLPNATLHYFRVTATNATGESLLSNQELATPNDMTPPAFAFRPFSAITGATSLTITADEPIRLIGDHTFIDITNNSEAPESSRTDVIPTAVTLGSDEMTVTITIPPTNFVTGQAVDLGVLANFAEDKSALANKNLERYGRIYVE